MIRIYWTRVDHIFQTEEWQRLFSLVPEFMQKRILKFKRWQDRYSALLGKLLLREGLLGFGYSEYLLNQWQVGPHGKPFIAAPVHFSISHTHGLVVCALTNRDEVGIDLEQIRPIELGDFQNMMEPEIWQTIIAADNRFQAFFEYWTLRESLVKADGRGLSVPFQALVIDNSQATFSSSFAPDHPGKSPTWHTLQITHFDGYSCHLATSWKNPDVSLQPIYPEAIK
ncbi:MAG: 4'-phosphopantetheinyl transferase [Magnetococcales bacterium]|nr:4'-phosphopantetheinyl transferase [Magnetococcales bacterium]